MIVLADCNNFYASCERVFNPQLKNKPIIVLSNNDGCVIARSNESKALGIKMGIPTFKIRDLIKKNNIFVFSSNFTLYGDLSQRVMSIMANNVPSIEIYSIDEAFMEIDEIQNKEIFAMELRAQILKWIGIPISIGIAPTKTLSKVANYIAKKQTKSGICILNDSEAIKKNLKLFSVNNIWGVGRKLSDLLYTNRINNAYELTQKSDQWIQNNMSILGLKMVKELRGEVCFSLMNKPSTKKSIMTSRTFGNEINSFNELAQAISTYASRCAEKLRKEGTCAKTIHIMIFTNPFKQKTPSYYKAQKTIYLNFHTNDSLKIVSSCIEALKSIYRSDCIYKRAGVIVADIIPKDQLQLTLFDNYADVVKKDKLMLAIDKLNNNWGKEKVRLGANGFKRNWEMSQKNLSPCYTTRIKDLIRIKY